MCQVHPGTCVSLLAPEKNDYTACHPEKSTMYILHVVFITTHTHVRLMSIRKDKENKRMRRKAKKRREIAKEKEKRKRQDKTRQDKTRQEEEREGKEKTTY